MDILLCISRWVESNFGKVVLLLCCEALRDCRAGVSALQVKLQEFLAEFWVIVNIEGIRLYVLNSIFWKDASWHNDSELYEH
jgi:hypothetical protein